MNTTTLSLLQATTLLVLTLVLSAANSALAAEFYVATTGSDFNSGTRAKPFATLERARDEGRKLNQTGLGGGRTAAVTIWLRGGDYIRKSTLELTAADSGTPQAPIVWRSYEGETVRLLGGRKLIGWDTVKEPTVLARLTENARSHVRQIGLRE